jgi:hypothetical protein
MQRSAFFVVACLVATCLSAQAPVPVVERVVTDGDVVTRVSLFSNAVVVLTISTDGTQGFLRRITLPDDQYMIYLGILQNAAGEIGSRPVTSAVSTSRNSVVLSLHVGPDAPREIRFSPMATVSLPLARIQGAMNDLESLVREASPSTEALRTWKPRRGDRVELMTGGIARVVEVLDEEVLVIENESTYIRQYIARDARDDLILRVLDREQ